MSTLEKAIEIAARAHAGVVDKGGHPYILHPLKVMFRLHAEDERIAAVLHDVVEDSNVTLEDLAAAGFSDWIVAAVDALTKRPGESRMQAAARASLHPVARAVKLADNTENMDLSRIAEPSAKDMARLAEYGKVRALLLSHDGP
jgi:guanosine-3',5'-bis(diphosphate) 3'-pyrophosphohydrolase